MLREENATRRVELREAEEKYARAQTIALLKAVDAAAGTFAQSCVDGDLNSDSDGDSPLKLSGRTDTSVALANILKRECAERLR